MMRSGSAFLTDGFVFCTWNPGGRTLRRVFFSQITERRLAMMHKCVWAGAVLLSLLAAGSVGAQKQIVLERRDATVVLEPYAPNIVRIKIGRAHV